MHPRTANSSESIFSVDGWIVRKFKSLTICSSEDTVFSLWNDNDWQGRVPRDLELNGDGLRTSCFIHFSDVDVEVPGCSDKTR